MVKNLHDLAALISLMKAEKVSYARLGDMVVKLGAQAPDMGAAMEAEVEAERSRTSQLTQEQREAEEEALLLYSTPSGG